jgi:hypothetical protein
MVALAASAQFASRSPKQGIGYFLSNEDLWTVG